MPKTGTVNKRSSTSTVRTGQQVIQQGNNGVLRKKIRKTTKVNSTPRQFPNVERLQEILRNFTQENPKEPKTRQRKRKGKGRQYTNLTKDLVQQMVFARYGSLTNFGTLTPKSYSQLEAQFRKPRMTIQTAIEKYKKRQGFFDMRKDNGAHVEFKVVKHGLQNMLLSRETLAKWSQFTLAHRCAILRQHYNIDIEWWALRNFYVKHNIGLYATNYVYQQSLNANSNQLRRFAVEIGDLIDKEKPVVYFDESSFNMWMRKNKTWMRSDEPIPVVLNKTRGENVTVYGAIGTCLPRALFCQTKVTNEQATILFMKKLRMLANENMRPSEPIHLILDNHAAHHTIRMRDVFSEHNIIPHFMPPYSPQFNSIEALWGIIKRKVKDRMALAPGTIEQLQFQQIVEDVCNSITPQQQARAASLNNRHFISKLIGDIIERGPEILEEDPLPVGEFVVPMPITVPLEPFDISKMLACDPEPSQDSNVNNNELSIDQSVGSVISKLPRFLQLSLDDSWAMRRP